MSLGALVIIFLIDIGLMGSAHQQDFYSLFRSIDNEPFLYSKVATVYWMLGSSNGRPAWTFQFLDVYVESFLV